MNFLKIMIVCSIILIGGGSSMAVIHDIDITTASGFDPDSLDVRPGDTVRWTNSSGTHQVVSDGSSPKSWDSGTLTVDDTYDEIFTYADGTGPFPYLCDDHQDETGNIYTKQDCWSIGDVNNDGIGLSLADLISLGKYLNNQYTPYNPYQADLNGDCVVDSDDYDVYDLYYIIGLNAFPTYPIPTCCYLNPCCNGIRGDANNDTYCNVGDAVFITNYIFSGGPEPFCFQEADANGDYALNVGDAYYIINYVFNGGPAPVDCP